MDTKKSKHDTLWKEPAPLWLFILVLLLFFLLFPGVWDSLRDAIWGLLGIPEYTYPSPI